MLEIEREFLSLVEEQSLYKADPRNERFLDKEIWEAKAKLGHDSGVEIKEGGKEWKECLQRILGALLKTS